VISYLGDFLFAPQRARSLVSSLSGGERNRLLLARLFARPANVLVLDEPTNDLDIETLELLEELLQEYSGTLFLVSHDRAFIDNVVTQTIACRGRRRLARVCRRLSGLGRLSGRSAQGRDAASGRRQTRRSAPGRAAKPGRQKAAVGGKLSWKETHELAELPQRIAALEAEQKVIGERLADPALYQSQPQEAQRLSARLAKSMSSCWPCSSAGKRSRAGGGGGIQRDCGSPCWSSRRWRRSCCTGFHGVASGQRSVRRPGLQHEQGRKTGQQAPESRADSRQGNPRGRDQEGQQRGFACAFLAQRRRPDRCRSCRAGPGRQSPGPVPWGKPGKERADGRPEQPDQQVERTGGDGGDVAPGGVLDALRGPCRLPR
jgi:energy-coupling factor transporter ATP-binding protein EcfA2